MIYKAGAIILNNQDLNLVLILFRGKEQDFSFPKGHVEFGENFHKTMVREISEETGLSNILDIKELPDLVYVHPEKGDITTKMFMLIADGTQGLVTEKPADGLEWVPVEEVENKLSYVNLKEYFKQQIPIISEIKIERNGN